MFASEHIKVHYLAGLFRNLGNRSNKFYHFVPDSSKLRKLWYNHANFRSKCLRNQTSCQNPVFTVNLAVNSYIYGRNQA